MLPSVGVFVTNVHPVRHTIFIFLFGNQLVEQIVLGHAAVVYFPHRLAGLRHAKEVALFLRVEHDRCLLSHCAQFIHPSPVAHALLFIIVQLLLYIVAQHAKVGIQHFHRGIQVLFLSGFSEPAYKLTISISLRCKSSL